MNTAIHKYKVAGHLFEVRLEGYQFLTDMIDKSYNAFLVANSDETVLLSARICGDAGTDDVVDKIYSEKKDSIENGKLEVYSTYDGWLFEQTMPYSGHPNSLVRINNGFTHADIALRGNEQQCWFAFNSAMMLCYMLATSQLDTILTHSSCVVNDGKAYLFLGKSGTGKSTHSSLWLKHIAETTLLNDDHPIIRVNDRGEVIAYGSPWSGKTPCYKNESAPVGGIVRISRAKHNSIIQLKAVQAYASLTTSFSGMTWVPILADSRHHTIEKIIESVPCYTLNCLPDEDAARKCHAAVTHTADSQAEGGTGHD